MYQSREVHTTIFMGSKNKIDPKFMHEELNVNSMHTKFGGHGLFNFRDLALFMEFSSKILWVPLV